MLHNKFDTDWDSSDLPRLASQREFVLPARPLECACQAVEWIVTDCTEAGGALAEHADGAAVRLGSPLAWAVFLGATTARKLAGEWGVSPATARKRLERGVHNGELVRVRKGIRTGICGPCGGGEWVYANASCSPREVIRLATMRQAFRRMPVSGPMPTSPGDQARAKQLLAAGAERWALGACTWWQRGLAERDSRVSVPHEGRSMGQGEFEFALRTTFNLELPCH